MTRVVKRTNRKAIIQRIVDLYDEREEAKAVKERVEKAQADAIVAMDAAGVPAIEIEYDGKILDAKVMRNSSIVIDEAALRGELGETIWKRVTSSVLDKKKLEALIAANEINPVLVAKCSTEKPIAPFIRIDKKAAN